MLRSEDNCVRMSISQKLLSGNGNRSYKHEMLFKLIRTCQFAVLLESNRLRYEDKSVSLSSHKNASQHSEQLFQLTSRLCCHRKATGIVLINTRCFSRLFAHDNVVFYWSPTDSGVKKIASACLSDNNAIQDSEQLFELTSSLYCHRKATGIVVINTRSFLTV